MELYLRVKFSSSLILRSVEWKSRQELIDTRKKGRTVFDTMGCDNREMLMAANGMHGEGIDDVKQLPGDSNKKEETTKRIAALFAESIL